MTQFREPWDVEWVTLNVLDVRCCRSSLKRTADTVKYLRKIPKVYWRVLDELDAGNCDGMTYEQVRGGRVRRSLVRGGWVRRSLVRGGWVRRSLVHTGGIS
jgi:hypothetical protein